MKGKDTSVFYRWVIVSCLILAGLSIFPSPLYAEAQADCGAYDTPSDGGGSITIFWNDSADLIPAHVDTLTVYRRAFGESDWDRLAETTAREKLFLDNNTIDGIAYEYRLEAKDSISGVQLRVGPVSSSPQWFNANRTVVLVAVLACLVVLAGVMYIQRSGKSFYVRPIRGLDAVDEAVGRATEMGRPVLYVPGIGEIDNIMTIASLTILSHVAKITARYETPLIVPTARAVVMSAAEEVVKEAYAEVGKPDGYNPDNIRYLSDAQFAFAGAVNGIMLREKPAANLYMGAFWAESLLLAETGFEAGAIQVAGTAMVSQLPFFVTACDFTLMGEELYAASAYLSREPKLLGGLKGSDWMKVLSITLMTVGVILYMLNPDNAFVAWFVSQ